MNTLPTELLAAIFQAGRGQRCEHASTFEVLVSHVSKHWREVALSTVTLWSTISLCGHRKNIWAPHYLERSKNAALDVELNFRQLDSGSIWLKGHILSVISLFTPHAAKLRNLDIKTYREETLSWILLQFQGVKMPQLEQLLVAVEEEMGDDEDAAIPNAEKITCAYASRLRKLHIDVVHCSWMPLTNIQELRLYGAWGGSSKLTVDQFVDVITAPLELTTLIVEGNLIDDSSWPIAGPLPSIHLPHLRTLRIASRVSFIYDIFSQLSAPLLKSAWFDLEESNSIQQLTSPGGPSFPSVRNLAFHTTASCEQLDCSRLIGVSRVFPGVTFLSISCFGKLCPVLEHLEAVDRISDLPLCLDTPHVFPNLKTIAVQGMSASKRGQPHDLASWPTLLADKICDGVRARAQVKRPLQEVMVEKDWLTAGLQQKMNQVIELKEIQVLNYHEPLWTSRFL